MSCNPEQRIKAHLKFPWFRAAIKSSFLMPYPDRATAELAEQAAITRELPLFNCMWLPKDVEDHYREVTRPEYRRRIGHPYAS